MTEALQKAVDLVTGWAKDFAGKFVEFKYAVVSAAALILLVYLAKKLLF